MERENIAVVVHCITSGFSNLHSCDLDIASYPGSLPEKRCFLRRSLRTRQVFLVEKRQIFICTAKATRVEIWMYDRIEVIEM